VNVAGATVLDRLFAELSEAHVAYDKVKHGVALTDWLITNDPGTLSELSDFLT
jgi:hypothetical protein